MASIENGKLISHLVAKAQDLSCEVGKKTRMLSFSSVPCREEIRVSAERERREEKHRLKTKRLSCLLRGNTTDMMRRSHWA